MLCESPVKCGGNRQEMLYFAAGISYITGKWEIMNLLDRYKDKQGGNFRLGEFHDDLINNGSLPISVIEWILLDDPSSL
jgi:hypothetical protein